MKKKKSRSPYTLPILLGLIILIVWALVTFLLHQQYCGYATPGQIGDSFGVVNSLFSGLAFGGIVYTIYMQRRDFNREITAIQRQRRESAFFNMLSLHLDIVRSVKIPGTTAEGVDAFKLYVEKFHQRLIPIIQYNHTKELNYCHGYAAHFDEYGSYFSQYLKSLLAMYKFIESNQLKEKAEQRYLDIIKAYITLYERKFLFYHLTLIADEKEKRELKFMESRLDLIRNLSGKDLNNNESHLELLIKYKVKYPLKGEEKQKNKNTKKKSKE